MIVAGLKDLDDLSEVLLPDLNQINQYCHQYTKVVLLPTMLCLVGRR